MGHLFPLLASTSVYGMRFLFFGLSIASERDDRETVSDNGQERVPELVTSGRDESADLSHDQVMNN